MISSSYVTELLQDIQDTSNNCNIIFERIVYMADTVCKQFIDRSQYTGNLDDHNAKMFARVENTEAPKLSDDEAYLKNMLQHKLQLNARLKAINENLITNSRQKSHTIKELADALSHQSQQHQKSSEIYEYRNRVGRYNVEIQKLKRQLTIETKRHQNEKANDARLEKRNSLPRNIPGIRNKIKRKGIFSCRNLNKSESDNGELRPLFEALDDLYLQEGKTMWDLKDEPSIMDETLDEPDDLDSDVDG